MKDFRIDAVLKSDFFGGWAGVDFCVMWLTWDSHSDCRMALVLQSLSLSAAVQLKLLQTCTHIHTHTHTTGGRP